MKISTPGLKEFIFDIVVMTDEWEVGGARAKRISYPKDFLRGAREVREKVLDSMEVAIGKKEDAKVDEQGRSSWENDKIEWVLAKGFKLPDGYMVITQRNSNEEIEFTREAVKAIKFFYSCRQDLPDVELAVLNEFENLMGISQPEVGTDEVQV